MRFPDGYMWDYPGFPSIVIPYGKTNDFFYSGHVGGVLIIGLEYRELGYHYPAGFCYFTMIMQIFLMIFLQGHYTIDLISGMIIAHYFYMLSRHWAPYFDRVCCRIYRRRFKAYY